jgi:hypothetical protein
MDYNNLDELTSLLEEGDETEYLKWKHLRDLASDRYDFSGFDHVNCYTKENFDTGVLEALERTRARLSITTAEKLIDFLYIFGYSIKRIIYILFTQKYKDWHRRDIQNYINRHGFRLRKERQQLMDEINNEIEGVFQRMKASVMKAEQETLILYLNKITKVQSELNLIDPIEETAKFKRLKSLLESMQDQVNKMHGLEALRAAHIEISSKKESGKIARSIDLGFFDDQLKANSIKSLPGENESVGGAVEVDVTVIR